MRFVRKGGIWKNTEDEILKVAVMKYGKNQWARISSLLVRKSAKQCKARWYEWLDPSVKKTEWSRDEEEKLLHLAKIMPSQWRSIASIVGRTATQCLDHYGKLLDQAQALDQGARAGDDLVQRLRPGDIDIHPESKPARPDPIDMDEDEKEMLSEARARLANTKGKKAKRKAREKQLEEARRLATLQKRRELKAAGIEFKGPPRPSKNKNKRREMDYNAEIPLERRVPKGFYDTGDEDRAAKRMRSAESFIGKSLADLDGKRRDEAEAAARKKDAKRQELMKKHDLPSYIAQINKLNDPQLQRPRPALQLPTPQITDKELYDLAAMGVLSGDRTPGLVRGPVPTPTPMRTPATSAGVDALVMEAQNLLALERAQTPLHGGENAFLHPSDFSGATPKPRAVQTPNPLALAGGLTPRTAQQPAMAQRTPVRDAFRINVAGDEYESTPAVVETDRQQLRAQLGALPKPRNEFGLAIAKVPDDDDDDRRAADDEFVPDADDVLRWERAQNLEAERVAFLLRSTVWQRPELPRPTRAGPVPVRFGHGDDDVESLIHRDMISRLEHDLTLKGAAPPSSVTLDELIAARKLIDDETGQVPFAASDERRDRVYVPSRDVFVDVDAATPAELCEGRRAQFESLSRHIAARTDAVTALERSIQARISPLLSRAKALRDQLLQTHRNYQQAVLDLGCFRRLHEIESVAIPGRLRRMQDEVARVVQYEDQLQQRYRDLAEKRAALVAAGS